MEQKLTIGEILKPQGITGSVKVKPYTDNVKRFKSLKKVYIDGTEYQVLKTSVAPDAVIIWLKGVADRNAAELLRGKFIQVDREDGAPLDDGKYYIVDVIGSALVTDTGKVLGKITDISTKSYADVYTAVTDNGKTVMFPLLKDLLVSIDIVNKIVTVKEKRFGEVSVYEN